MSADTFGHAGPQGSALPATGEHVLSPGIFHDVERRIWVLTTRRSSFALGVTPRKSGYASLLGPRLLSARDLTTATLPSAHSSHDPASHLATEEYAPWGGLRFGETAIKATFVDGTRDLDLQFVHAEVDELDGLPTLIIELHDAVYPRGVTLCYQLDCRHDMVICSIAVTNSGPDQIVLERTFSALRHLPRQSAQRTLTTLACQWFGETRIQCQPVVVGTAVIESRRGTTGFTAYPWFALDTATANNGEVYFGSLAWSGNWTLHLATSVTGATTGAGGIHDYDFAWLVNRLKVRPKVSVDSPCVEPSPKFFRGRRFDTTSTL